jgi:hypothetical protein
MPAAGRCSNVPEDHPGPSGTRPALEESRSDARVEPRTPPEDVLKSTVCTPETEDSGARECGTAPFFHRFLHTVAHNPADAS